MVSGNDNLVNSVLSVSNPVVNVVNVINEVKLENEVNKVSDHTLLENIGYNFVISDKLLGHGSYGDVYLATDEKGKQIAIKCCNLDEYGIPNILESSIMMSLIHPYINRALRIQASEKKLYIIQELAITDLSEHTKRNKGNHTPKIDQLRTWCFSLAHAVYALHGEGIIHGDIKASNVLLYADNSIKLADFTLAIKQWSNKESFTHTACTCTHRPLECLLQRPWTKSLDIWSLACTFYEIAYGELLFPYQGCLEPEETKKTKAAKLRLRDRSANVIIDWATRGPSKADGNKETIQEIGINQFPLKYIPFKLCDEYNSPEMETFNDLLNKMLIVDPFKRLKIEEVLRHPFFYGLKAPMYLSVKRPVKKIKLEEEARVNRYIQRYTNNTTVQALALNIYCSCNDLNNIDEHVRAATCVWIAAKIIVGYPPKMTLQLHLILMTEREICHNLSFRLHQL